MCKWLTVEDGRRNKQAEFLKYFIARVFIILLHAFLFWREIYFKL